MPDETRGPETPETPVPAEPPPVSDAVRQTMLQLANWQEITERIKERVRTSKLKPPEDPPEVIS
jgi:hypothetical protein